jgi:hypothetical protein
MIYYFKIIIDSLGIGIFLSIITFFIGILIAFYLTFKSYYRLTYSCKKTCKDCLKIKDWKKDEALFESRIIFYNNGRKTITKNEIKHLKISSSHNIKNAKVLKAPSNVKILKTQKNLSVEIEYIDATDFILIEVVHTGTLSIDGRVSETGKLLDTETTIWKIINILYIIFFFSIAFYNTTLLHESDMQTFLLFGINLLILFAIYLILRFIHKLLFIPDKISSKYFDTIDKSEKEFKKQF